MIVRLIPLLILVLFRFYDLGARPIHHDESVNGWFVDGILAKGFYSYDPQNYHGPFFFYILTLFEKIFGRSVEALRIPTVIIGSAITFTPLLFRKWLGDLGAFFSCLIFALSPALVFYSRYSIHETFFVFSMILFFYNWLKVRKEGFTVQSVFGFGLTLGLLATLKENFVLFGGCLVLSEGILWIIGMKPSAKLNSRFWFSLGASFLIGFLFIVICFTGFFQDGEGITKFLKAFELWSETGSHGNGHQKPIYYWLSLMLNYEWPALIGLGLAFFSIKKGPMALRLLAVLSVSHWLVYSLVSYKTPWCMMSFYWGLILIAGYWFSVWYQTNLKALVIAGLMGGLSWSGYLAYDVSYLNPDQDGHPYIYGQTYHDMLVPLKEIVDRGLANPALHDSLRIQVVSSFTWPLPYVLGEFKQVAYYGQQNTPPTLEGDYVIMDKDFEPEMSRRLQGSYLRGETRSRQWANPIVFFKKH